MAATSAAMRASSAVNRGSSRRQANSGSIANVRPYRQPAAYPRSSSSSAALDSPRSAGQAARERRCADARPERLSLEQLDRDVRNPLVAPDVVNGDDVGVRQRRDRAGFAIEPLVEVQIGRRVGRQRLDRDLPLQPRITRAIDLAHSAFAQFGENLVWPTR
jgi:hypothetical protein